MRRREFITLLGGAAAAWPFAARAQERVRRIGVLMSSSEADPEIQARMAALRQGLVRFGWSEGRNIQFTYYFTAGSAEQAASFAKELVALKPDLIVATATSLAAALQRETRVIPIVFTGVVDPVRSGLIASLARPGGNLTGGLLNEPSVVGKWLGMLKEYAPELKRVAVLTNPKSGPYQSFYQETAQAVAQALGVELVPSLIEGPADIERTVAGFAAGQDGGLLVPPDLTAASHHDLVIEIGRAHV